MRNKIAGWVLLGFLLIMSSHVNAASSGDDGFIYIPTSQQLLKWWEDRTKEKSANRQLKFLDFIDQLLWDPKYLPNLSKIADQEKIGQTMVLQIQ